MDGKLFKYILAFMVALGAVSLSVYAIETPNGAALTEGTTGQFTNTSAASLTAQGGNVTYVNISSNSTTTKWHGFYGNVSGGVRLGSGTTVFYDFGEAAYTTVFAAPSTGTAWGSLATTTAGEIDTQWSFGNAADVDQAVDIFTSTDTVAGVASVPVATIGTGGFKSGIMEDGGDAAKADYVFAGKINATGAVGFGGDTFEYQLMVPVESAPETYYFYVSLE